MRLAGKICPKGHCPNWKFHLWSEWVTFPDPEGAGAGHTDHAVLTGVTVLGYGLFWR